MLLRTVIIFSLQITVSEKVIKGILFLLPQRKMRDQHLECKELYTLYRSTLSNHSEMSLV
jgi:hypothetical protein